MKEKIVEAHDFSVTKGYGRKWLALSEDYKTVLATGDSLGQLMEKLPRQKRIVVYRAFPKYPYIPGNIRVV
jgi:hypothetical protein